MKRNCLSDGPFISAPEHTFEADLKILKQIRTNVSEFLDTIQGEKILEVGPCGDFHRATHTLDIDPKTNPTFVGDVTQDLTFIGHTYDTIICCEVLEHVTNPFHAVRNLEALLKPEGKLYISVPYQFRIHGPLPDCWRISEFGLRSLASDSNLKVEFLECLLDPDRPYFPLHYTCILKKDLDHVTAENIVSS
jgi:SAM-dependent methyltransferase